MQSSQIIGKYTLLKFVQRQRLDSTTTSVTQDAVPRLLEEDVLLFGVIPEPFREVAVQPYPLGHTC